MLPGCRSRARNASTYAAHEVLIFLYFKAARYDVGLRGLLCLADAEIRTGAAASHRGSFQPPLLSLKCRSESWDSRSKPVPVPRSYAHGVSATGTGATYQSGCSTSGKSRWIQTWAGESVSPLRRRSNFCSPGWCPSRPKCQKVLFGPVSLPPTGKDTAGRKKRPCRPCA
jgi:hypothetical protein